MCLTLASEAVCCAGAACCSATCCCCKVCCKTTFKEQIKLAYIMLNVVVMLVVLCIFYFLQNLFGGYMDRLDCQEVFIGSKKDSDCLGISNIYRISFVLMWMYIILIIFMLCRGEVAKIANEGCWPLKLLFILIFFIGCCFIGNHFFDGYVYFAIAVSGVYMLFQIIMLIDLFYLWGQSWVQIFDQGGEYMKYILIITALLLYTGAFTLNAYNFIWFGTCSLNIFMNVFTIILIIAITVVQLLGYNPQGSLITSGAMAVYIVYQSFSAQSSSPEQQCNQLYEKKDGLMAIEISIGFILNIAALMYLTFGTAEASTVKIGDGAQVLETKQQKVQDKQDEDQGEEANEQQELLQKQQEQQVVEKKTLQLQIYETNQYVIFHIIMFISVVYMATLITNWGKPSETSSTGFDPYTPNSLAFWVKMVVAWLAALIYTWTLLAPCLMPDRSFE